MNVVVTIGSDEDQAVTIDVTDDSNGYTPEVLEDVLRRCGERAFWLYRELHPAP